MGGRWIWRVAPSRDSCVTDHIVRAIAGQDAPGVFISGSAVGKHGDRAKKLTEGSASGDGFLAQPVARERGAAGRSAGLAVRLRNGVILGRAGARWRACCRRLKLAWVDLSEPASNTAVDSSPRSREHHRGGPSTIAIGDR
jgi:NAD dependent epimerase/dehydratase family enzyme